jgi:hypothetical protein
MKKTYLIAFALAAIITVVMIVINTHDNSNKHYYFDFDEVVHYKTDITEDNLLELRNKKIKTVKDSMLLRNICEYTFESISDNRAITYLDSIGFEKKTIISSKYPAIRNIFKESNHIYESSKMCEPIYRNIYVFKKNSKVSGIAKVCYDCE